MDNEMDRMTGWRLALLLTSALVAGWAVVVGVPWLLVQLIKLGVP